MAYNIDYLNYKWDILERLRDLWYERSKPDKEVEIYELACGSADKFDEHRFVTAVKNFYTAEAKIREEYKTSEKVTKRLIAYQSRIKAGLESLLSSSASGPDIFYKALKSEIRGISEIVGCYLGAVSSEPDMKLKKPYYREIEQISKMLSQMGVYSPGCEDNKFKPEYFKAVYVRDTDKEELDNTIAQYYSFPYAVDGIGVVAYGEAVVNKYNKEAIL